MIIIVHRALYNEEGVSQGRLWDSESCARRYIELNLGDKALGVFPVELNLPI